MRRVLYVVLVAAALAAVGGGSYALAGGDEGGARARLNGYNEVVGPGSISTTGRGKFAAKIDRGARTITYRLTYTLENPATAAHIHFAQRHVGGGVIAFLCGGGGKPPCPAGVNEPVTVTGTITPENIIGPEGQGIEPRSFDEAVRAIRAGATYVNVHSSRWMAGEIRGQIGGKHRGHHDED